MVNRLNIAEAAESELAKELTFRVKAGKLKCLLSPDFIAKQLFVSRCIMAALCNTAGHYILPCGFFFLSICLSIAFFA